MVVKLRGAMLSPSNILFDLIPISEHLGPIVKHQTMMMELIFSETFEIFGDKILDINNPGFNSFRKAG
jgi:hypothetical protein